MYRPLVAVLLLVLTAACTTQVTPASAPPTSTPVPTAVPTPTVTPPESDAPEPTATPEPAAPTWTGHPAEGLALVRRVAETDQATQVFVIEADGSARQVTGLSGDLGATFPVWSPDGERIAFNGPKRGETTVSGMLAVVNADGSDERQIAEGAFPRWSPDGSRIAFVEVDDVTGTDLSFYLVDPETGEITDLGLGVDPRWVGSDRLTYGATTYAADGEATAHLYLMDLSTGQSRPIEDWANGYPSPDGSQILVAVDEVVWLADAEGNVTRELTDGFEALWSPDGTAVAVAVGHDNDANPVWNVVDLEGNELQSDIIGANPTWSPDGTRLALEVYRPDMPVIQVVDVASGEVVWEEQGQQPAWRP
jgi:Tol biopolymer transport system component